MAAPRRAAGAGARPRPLVRAWGADTLAPFVLRSDKSYFFSADESAFLAYRVVGGVAIVSGDPIGPRDPSDELVGEFVRFARARDWRVAVLGASEQRLEGYARHGLHALYHGDEAVVETEAFSLEGRAIRKVRQSVHRLEDAGFRARVLRPGEVDVPLRARLEEVARAWRGGAPERGFVMALDALFALDDEEAVFVVGFGPDGRASGFLHFALSPAGSALSLASMPRLHDTPNGFNEWLICAAIAWARDAGYRRVSLNFAPFAALLAPGRELTALQRLQRRALLALKGRFQLDNLLVFNRKFLPAWQPRFVVYESRRDLPRVGPGGARRRGVPALPGRAQVRLAGGLLLALVSTAALNWGWIAQHGAATKLPSAEPPPATRLPAFALGRALLARGFPRGPARLGAVRRRARSRAAVPRPGRLGGRDRDPGRARAAPRRARLAGAVGRGRDLDARAPAARRLARGGARRRRRCRGRSRWPGGS